MRDNQPKHRQMRKEQRLIWSPRALTASPLRNAAGVSTQVQLIASCPSIEFWLLQHVEYTARPFRNAADAEQALRAQLPDYRKNDRDIFPKTAAGFDLSCQRAAQLKADLRANGGIAPNTDMHLRAEQFRRWTFPVKTARNSWAYGDFSGSARTPLEVIRCSAPAICGARMLLIMLLINKLN